MSELTKCDCAEGRVMAIQYELDSREHYDGVSEYRCMDCGNRVGRFSGRVLDEGEQEKATARFMARGVEESEEWHGRNEKNYTR